MASIYGIEAEIIAVIISLFSLGIAIYALTRDKPKLSVEKCSANYARQDNKNVIFTFFLNNYGNQPTTIKSIEFSTRDNFIPSAVFFERLTGAIANIAGHGVKEQKIKNIDVPFTIMPNTSKKIEAQLNFDGKKINDSQIHFNVVIKHTKGKLKKYI